MLIKYQALIPHLQKKMHAMYVLVGADQYLLNDAALSIKKAWAKVGETDTKIIHINGTNDWTHLQEEANSYSLFAEHVLIDARLDKKTLDSAGKAKLTQYLQQANPRCLILLHASAVPIKSLQWLVSHAQVVVVQLVPLAESALKQWIATQFTQRSISFSADVPSLIHQYSQGNMLACAQNIEKLALISDDTSVLSAEIARTQLIDQCEFQLYELADACHAADSSKAIHLLRLACHHRAEPTLILWLLTQEIRQLMKLSLLLKHGVILSTACDQLKIWPQRVTSYGMSLKRLANTDLRQLLHESKRLDERIKTSQSHQVWHGLEQLALSLCLGGSAY